MARPDEPDEVGAAGPGGEGGSQREDQGQPPPVPEVRQRFDKFTDRARKVLVLAQEEAQRFNHNYIGTEHLLLGLVREGEGIGARILTSAGVDLQQVRAAVEHIIGRGFMNIQFP